MILAGKGTLCEKMIKPVFDYSVNPSTLSSNINRRMFLDPDSTTILANEIRPLNFTTQRSWLLQIGADWKLPISDQARGDPTPGALSNLVSLSICVSEHGSGLGAPESLSCSASCWEISYLPDLFSLVEPHTQHSRIYYFSGMFCYVGNVGY